MDRANTIAVIVLGAAVIAIQQLTAVTGTQYYLTQLTMAAYYALVVIGLCLVMGYAGQISLGHAGFFGIGGYISAALTTHNLAPLASTPVVSWLASHHLLIQGQDLYGDTLLTVPPWLACAVALTVTIIIAILIGVPVLKLKGHYLAMATLGFGTIIYRLVLATEFFGEADGISEVPPLPLPGGLAVSGDFSARISNYYLAWGVLACGMILLLNLINSRAGRGLRAIHSAEDAAAAMGVNAPRYKLLAFVISAVFAAAAGVLLTHYNGGIGPSEAGIMKSVRYVALVAVGGMASLWGTMLVGVGLNFLSLRGLFGSYDDAVFGAILIAVMLFAPEGILRLRLVSALGRGRRKKP